MGKRLIAKIKDDGSAFSQDEIYTDFNKLYRKYTIMNKDLGEFFKRETKDILKKFGWEPITLQSKEGLALINGTQFMSAYGMHNLMQAERLLRWADIIAAISFARFLFRW